MHFSKTANSAISHLFIIQHVTHRDHDKTEDGGDQDERQVGHRVLVPQVQLPGLSVHVDTAFEVRGEWLLEAAGPGHGVTRQ